MHVEPLSHGREAMRISCSRRGGGAMREVRPDLCDGIEGVKVTKNGVFTVIPGPLSPVNVQLAICQCKAVACPGRRHGAIDRRGDFSPDLLDVIEGMEIAQQAI